MITPRDIKPEKSLYAIGAILIQALKQFKSDSVRLEDLYKNFSLLSGEKITFSYFSYAVDWLFLLGLIKIGEKPSEITKCF